MNFIHKNIVSKILLLVLTFQLFNLSIDIKTDDFNNGLAEEIKLNEQESVLELVLEKWLDIENAIEEHDEQDNNNDATIDQTKVYLFIKDCQTIRVILPKMHVSKKVLKQYLFSDQKNVCDIDIPPPQV